MSKRIDDRTFEKFGRDVNTLKSLYTAAKIAEAMQVNAGNFSSLVNGAKRPGQAFIDRFYRAWGEQLEEIRAAERAIPRNARHMEVNESAPDFYNRTPQIPQEHNKRLQLLEERVAYLDSVVAILVDRLLESNQKLIDAHLLILGQQAERTSSQPAVK